MRRREIPTTSPNYAHFVSGIQKLLEEARRQAARSVNAILTVTYWEVGRRIVEFEQGGKSKAQYGEKLLKCLASDLRSQFGRGFSKRNLEQMRLFYLDWPIAQTASAKSVSLMRKFDAEMLTARLGLIMSGFFP